VGRLGHTDVRLKLASRLVDLVRERGKGGKGGCGHGGRWEGNVANVPPCRASVHRPEARLVTGWTSHNEVANLPYPQ
jgi:hypothetical protein